MDHPRRSWSDLPDGILHLFLDRLYYADRWRFAAVCKPWCSAVAGHRSPPIPLLVLKNITDDDVNSLLLLSPVEDGKVHRLKIPDIDYSFYGSSRGFLFMEDAILFHPFTQQQIDLPPSSKVFEAVSMSSTAATVGDGMFAALYSKSKLAFCRLGDETWSYFPDLEITDFLFHEGLVYCIDESASLFVLELGANPKIKESYHPTVVGATSLDSLSEPDRLVLVLRGEELLMVVEHSEESVAEHSDGSESEDSEESVTVRLDVFRLNPGRTEWVPVKNLDGWVLFLCRGCSLALEASKYPTLRPNCIFFPNFDGDGCYLFSLEDGSCQLYHKIDPDYNLPVKWLLHNAA